MRSILRITKTELRILFYSPVAWLVLIVFALQAGIAFCTNFTDELRSQALGYALYTPTASVFCGLGGVVTQMLDYLYLYIPLLTMGLMSRELGSGSIKLLYSSPVSNMQIIAGKYLSMAIYCLGFVLVLLLQATLGLFAIKDAEITAVLVAVLGLYLTVCAYAAIGLFMSTITRYQVVAAIGTLVVLAVLNFIGRVGQDMDFVRDLTFWLSISGRSQTFMYGMINSADLLYFLLVIGLFLTLSVVRLQGERIRSSAFSGAWRYCVVIGIVLGLGYISSRPRMIHYYDGTSTKRNTLARESQDVVNHLDGGLTLTTYVNIFEENAYIGMPGERNWDMERFEKFMRFKPEIEFRYVYYYRPVPNQLSDERIAGLNDRQRLERICDLNDYDIDMFQPYDEIARNIDLSGENYRFVRVFERAENGRRAFLRLYEDPMRHPSETEIATALKTLYVSSPRVGFVIGHDERSIDNFGDRGYGVFARENTFRQSLVNTGFKVEKVSLTKPVDSEMDVLLISDMRKPFSLVEMENYRAYIARGGNLIVLGEPKRQDAMNPLVAPFGLRFTADPLVRPTSEFLADLVVGHYTPDFGLRSKDIATAIRYKKRLTAVGTCGVEQIADVGYNVVDCVVTDSTGVWNEHNTRNFVDEVPTLDSQYGEDEKQYSLVKYLTRTVGDREQRIFVVGDSDCIAGRELIATRNGISASNFSLIQGMFKLLSYGEFPVEPTRERPSDDEIYLTQDDSVWIKILYEWLIPGVLLVSGILILMKRRNQ